MNQKKKRIFVMLLSLCMIVLLAAPAAAGTSAKAAAAKKAYTDYMKKRSVTYYRLTDLDKNGVPELLLCENYGVYKLCTYNSKTKKVIVRKETFDKWWNPENFRYNLSKNRVLLTGASTGGATFTIVKVQGLNIKTIRTLESRRNYPGFSYTYYVNKKKVSEKTFDKYLNDAKKLMKPVK